MEPLLIDLPDELSTARLRLRVPRAGDGAMICASFHASIAELMSWMPWAKADYSETDGELWCRKSFVEFHSRQGVSMILLLGDRHIGNVGAFGINWKVRSCEIGYWLRTDETGHGYMTEAVEALSLYLQKHANMHRIQICCDTRNLPSANVAKRCGYTLEGTRRHDGQDPSGAHRDTHVFSRLFASA